LRKRRTTKSKRHAEQEDQLDGGIEAQAIRSLTPSELAKNKTCEEEGLSALARAAKRDLVTHRTKGEVHEAAELEHALKVTQYVADIAAAPAAEQEHRLDGGNDYRLTGEIGEKMSNSTITDKSRRRIPAFGRPCVTPQRTNGLQVLRKERLQNSSL
jgi:hypothetical protein